MIKILQYIVILTGLTFNGQSQTMMTFGQIYDFDINDEFHYTFKDVPPNAQRYRITEKFYTISQDSVCYIRLNDNYLSHVNWNPSPHLEYSFHSYIDTVCYGMLNTICDSAYVNWPINDSIDTYFFDSLYYSVNLCGSLVYEYNACGNCSFEGFYKFVQYGQGLGKTEYSELENNMPPTGYHYKMFYFKKGNIECGTPDLTALSISENDYLNSILIYPNPCKDYIYISSDLSSTQTAELTIYTSAMQKVYNKVVPVSAEQASKLALPGLKPGIYFIEVLSESTRYAGKLLIE